MIAQKYTFKRSHFEADKPPTLQDFEITQEVVNDKLEPGEVLIKAEYISPDPYGRGAGGLEGKPLEITDGEFSAIPGSQVGRVIASTHPEFPVNCIVCGFFGWRSLTRYKPGSVRSWNTIYKLPSYFEKLPISYALGAIGTPGITAHCAVEKVLGIKNGGTLVVSTATGAVGNMVLQIGKLKGCKTLVFTSTDEKVIWLKTLGAGYIFNYSKVDPVQVFKEFAEEGIDFYFDNMGGTFTYHVMKHMKPHGRIAVCDAISCYSGDEESVKTVPFDYLTVVDKRIRLEGFSVYEYGEKEWAEAMATMAKWISEGQIKVEETVLEGFDKLAQAFIDRYEGRVVGMQVVKA